MSHSKKHYFLASTPDGDPIRIGKPLRANSSNKVDLPPLEEPERRVGSP